MKNVETSNDAGAANQNRVSVTGSCDTSSNENKSGCVQNSEEHSHIDSPGPAYSCKLCKNEMKESVAMIKAKRGRKVKDFPVHCMRCVECGSVRLSEAQVLELPEEVTMDEFLAYVFLQDRISTMRLQQKGIIKEELPKAHKIVV